MSLRKEWLPELLSRSASTVAATRRADFRFLLATPVLKHVLLVAPLDSSLEAAVRLISESVATVHDLSTVHRPASFDVVILADPDSATVQQIDDLVGPGGSVYIEFAANSRYKARRLLSSLQALRAIGFREVSTLWHRPDFRQCCELVVLNSKRPLQHVLGRRFGAITTRFASSLVREALLSQCPPMSLSILAQRQRTL